MKSSQVPMSRAVSDYAYVTVRRRVSLSAIFSIVFLTIAGPDTVMRTHDFYLQDVFVDSRFGQTKRCQEPMALSCVSH